MENKCKVCINFPCSRNECDIINGSCKYGKSVSSFFIKNILKENRYEDTKLYKNRVC